VKAYPTKYAGTQFRSRLEARWAAFFDVMAWPWEYEPFDLKGYIPDFIVDAPYWPRTLVEVKPALKLTDYQTAQRKIDRSGWKGLAATVGAKIGEACDGASPGRSWLGMFRTCPDIEPGQWIWEPWDVPSHETNVAAWREAGNRVQWRGVGKVTAKPQTHSADDDAKLTYPEVQSFFGNLSSLLDD